MATNQTYQIRVEGFGNIYNSAGGNDVEVALKNFIVALKAAGHKVEQARLITLLREDNLADPLVYPVFVAGSEL